MALPNDFKTVEWIANKGLAYLIAGASWIKCGTPEYSPEFDNTSFAVGDTIQVRQANRRRGGEGAVVTIDGIIEKTDTLTIEKQFHDAMDFTSKQKTMFMQSDKSREIYAERYIKPSIMAIISKVETYLSEKAEEDLIYTAGSANAPLNSIGAFNTARAVMKDLHMPLDTYENYLLVSSYDDAALKTSLPSLFLPKTNDAAFKDYFLTDVAGFKYQDTPIVKLHVAGAASDDVTYPNLTVKTTVSSGNTIIVTGFGGVKTGVFLKGDIIHVNGATIVVPNPIVSTRLYTTFVVTDTSVDSDINGDAVVHVKQEIISDTNNPFVNVSNPLYAGSKVTCEKDHNVNAAMVGRCLSYASPPVASYDDGSSYTVSDTELGTGLSLRVAKDKDITNDKNIMRFDIFFGARFWHNYGVRLLSKPTPIF